MRCAAYSSITNRPLHVPKDDAAGYEEGGSAIDHFHDKLLLIKGRLKTEQGKKMGEKRHHFVSRLAFDLINFGSCR